MTHAPGLLKYLARLTILTLICLPGFATITTYSDRATWTGNITPVIIIDFEGIAPIGTAADLSTPAGIDINGIKFTGIYSATVYSLRVANLPTVPGYNWGSGAVMLGDEYYNKFERKIHVILPTPIYAFGVDVMAGSTQGVPLTVRINGSTNYLVNTFAAPRRGFFGIISDTPITTIDIVNTPGTIPIIDNFTTAILGAPQPPTPRDNSRGEHLSYVHYRIAVLVVRREQTAETKLISSLGQ